MNDQRKSIRVYPDSKNPVEVQIMGDGFLDIFHARDVSANGIGIEVPYKFEGCDIDKPIDLVITLPPDNCFKARGIIKHSNAELTSKGIFGVKLTSFEKGYENEIKTYVKEMIKKGKI
jgi:hypothetical protein